MSYDASLGARQVDLSLDAREPCIKKKLGNVSTLPDRDLERYCHDLGASSDLVYKRPYQRKRVGRGKDSQCRLMLHELRREGRWQISRIVWNVC